MPDSLIEIDTEALQESADFIGEYSDQLERKTEAASQLQQQQEVEENKALATQKDPRDADEWGIKALAKEGQSILSGGLQDTASSIATFPERTADALSGEMQREKKETGQY